ncbi:MAG TPA: NeuD/PglB/VioB family sugar acetyltransferase [Cyclobacteriaceae bacterium]|nr:NeuD/PglB/VioB family sugar acetyltransferase [Cyclobacteriaceae bacterium]
MKDIAIYGAGGLGRETALLIDQVNEQSPKWNLIGFYDDGIIKGIEVDGMPVLGGIQEINEISGQLSLVVPIADSDARQRAVNRITNSKIEFPSIVHPSCLAGSKRNIISRGCILSAGAILTTGISLGEFVIINLLTTVGHDVSCSAFVTIMPGANISGNVGIGSNTLVGTGAKILPNLSIGHHCRVGAGAVVTKDVKDGTTVVGIPANEK